RPVVDFAPTDLIWWLRHAMRHSDEAMLVDVFRAGLHVAHERLAQSGQRLLLRDHAHSQFCRDVDADSRPTLHEMLVSEFPVLSVVTVRHPLDS
ncbi:sulfotransferase family protein, partial [bacterium LRH843]|nr:sulfotransferase family protein [bacterium LRH843]